jgi:hypothetical protein
MKKAIAILLVLLVAGAAFGATGDTAGSTSLTLNSLVSPNSDLFISDTDLSGSIEVSNFSSLLTSNEITEVSFDDENLSAILYVYMKSNIRAGYTVVVESPSALASTIDTTTTIGYSINGTAVDGSSNFTLADIDAGNGMRIANESFTIAMTQADWDLASADITYTTDWTVNMISK